MSQSGIISIAAYPTVPTIFQEDVNTASPSGGIIKFLGGAGITTSGSGDTVTITATGGGGGGVTWQGVTSANNPVSLATLNGYVVGGVAQVNFVLPVSAALGDTFIITGFSALFQIQQGAGQQIFFGTQSTTAGVDGSITSLQAEDHINLLCVVANTKFKIFGAQGNLTVI